MLFSVTYRAAVQNATLRKGLIDFSCFCDGKPLAFMSVLNGKLIVKEPSIDGDDPSVKRSSAEEDEKYRILEIHQDDIVAACVAEMKSLGVDTSIMNIR